MISSDILNSLFEFAGALFIVNNIRLLIKEKAVSGVSAISTLYFSAWGYWNLYYYPALNQPWSFYGALALAVSNSIWVALMIYYRRTKWLHKNFHCFNYF